MIIPTSMLSREQLRRLTDHLAVATVASLPWSTSATSILIVLLLLALLPTLDLHELRHELLRPAGGLPVLLWFLAVIGIGWAVEASWRERLEALASFHRLLVIPLLLVHFSRSPRAGTVMLAFLISETVLLAASIVHAASWGLDPSRIDRVPGVPVKTYITQSACFAICAFALLGMAIADWQQGRWRHAVRLLLLAAVFVADILYVATSRTTLVALPVLVLLVGFRHDGRRGVLVAAAACVIVAAFTWASSSYLRERVESVGQQVHTYATTGAPTSSGIRLEYWRKAAQFIADAPMVGHGTGSINELYRRSQTRDEPVANIRSDNPHQQVLTVALQLGALGAGILIAMWLAHARLFWRSGPAAWAGLVLVVESVVCSMFNSSLFDFTEGWLYVIGVGVLGGMVRRGQKHLSTG